MNAIAKALQEMDRVGRERGFGLVSGGEDIVARRKIYERAIEAGSVAFAECPKDSDGLSLLIQSAAGRLVRVTLTRDEIPALIRLLATAL